MVRKIPCLHTNCAVSYCCLLYPLSKLPFLALEVVGGNWWVYGLQYKLAEKLAAVRTSDVCAALSCVARLCVCQGMRMK